MKFNIKSLNSALQRKLKRLNDILLTKLKQPSEML